VAAQDTPAAYLMATIVMDMPFTAISEFHLDTLVEDIAAQCIVTIMTHATITTHTAATTVAVTTVATTMGVGAVDPEEATSALGSN